MFSLHPLLTRYARTVKTIQAGADEIAQSVPSEPLAAPLDKRRFIADLAALRRTNTIAIATLVGALLATFVVILLMIWKHSSNPIAVASLFVGYGGLSTGITTPILGAFRGKTQSALMEILARNMGSMSIQTAIDVLAKRSGP